MVLCESLKGDGTPDKANKRSSCAEAMEKIKDKKPWFGLGKSLSLTSRDEKKSPFEIPLNTIQIYTDMQTRTHIVSRAAKLTYLWLDLVYFGGP